MSTINPISRWALLEAVSRFQVRATAASESLGLGSLDFFFFP
jgi:hypothetical protein